MLGFARMVTSQTNAVIRRYSALVDGALLKVRSDRPEMAQYCTNTLQAATSNCACARLSVRNVGERIRCVFFRARAVLPEAGRNLWAQRPGRIPV